MPANPEELLRRWKVRVPPGGAECKEALLMMRHLGMEVTLRSNGHYTGKHPGLVGSAWFPQGVITVNCHAFGKQGTAHPAAVRDIVRAAGILEEGNSND